MEQNSHEFKYQKHSEKQYLRILSVAERLFVDNGIEKVNLADIVSECGIMRSTFYRYFKNKDEVLWHITHRHMSVFSKELKERFQNTSGTTFDRFKSYLDILYEGFLSRTKYYLFLDIFNGTYQNVTSTDDDLIYNKIYKTDDFRSGDAVRFLTENFHDGSVKSDLDPKTTAVTIVYGGFSIVAGMSKQIKTLPIKYDVGSEKVVRISFDALLESIKA